MPSQDCLRLEGFASRTVRAWILTLICVRPAKGLSRYAVPGNQSYGNNGFRLLDGRVMLRPGYQGGAGGANSLIRARTSQAVSTTGATFRRVCGGGNLVIVFVALLIESSTPATSKNEAYESAISDPAVIAFVSTGE
jgi:hypothetical protein